jgi:recombination protein RecA
MSKAMRKLAAILNTKKCTVIFINQLREKVGVMYGNPETTTGGRALKFYASVRMDIRRTEAIKNGAQIVGNTVNVKIVKNKVAPPFKNCLVDIIYGKGISRNGEILELGTELGILKKSGSWFEYNGERFANGKEAGKAYLEEHPEFAEELMAKVREANK